MKKRQYEFDLRNVSVRKVGFDLLKLLIGILKVFIVSLSLFIVVYAVVANFVSTDTEKRLRKDKEYAAYEKERRKLSIEIAKVISEGGIPSAEQTRRYDELEKLIKSRKELLDAE